MRGLRVLILAGQREGVRDPLLVGTDTTYKALLPIHDKPMIEYVLAALDAARTVSRPYGISGIEIDLIGGDLLQFPKGAGPATSVVAAFDAELKPPFLVTTCDHPLLSDEMVDMFLTESMKSGVDFTLGLAAKDVIAPAYPNVKRTYLRFSDLNVSGCNLFYIANEKGMEAIRFWQSAQNDRKHPVKLARRLGIATLLKYVTGRLTLGGAFQHASKMLGITAKPILLPFAEAAIDVDKPSDLALVTEILANR